MQVIVFTTLVMAFGIYVLFRAMRGDTRQERAQVVFPVLGSMLLLGVGSSSIIRGGGVAGWSVALGLLLAVIGLSIMAYRMLVQRRHG